MRTRLIVALCLMIACATGPMQARAGASAVLTLNAQTVSLDTSGSNVRSPLFIPYGVELAAGQSADITFQYAYTLRSDGLPVERPQGELGADVFGCIGLPPPSVCGPAYTGFEVAKLFFDVLIASRTGNPAIVFTADANPRLILQTRGDSFADLLQGAGTIHVHVTNTSPVFGASAQFTAVGSVWVLAVPEPQTWALLAAGLAALVVMRLPRLERRPKRPA
jgi:hypothetical protein